MKKNGLFLFSVFLFVCFCSCHFVSSFKEENKNDAVTLTFDKNKASVDIGSMEIINLTTSKNQNSASIKWSYDSSIINAQTDNYSAIITGLQPGTTSVTASCGDNSVTCFVTVSSSTHVVQVLNPYVYTSTDYVQVKPSETVRISASLFGGTAADLSGFSWTIDKPSVADISVENNYCWITGRSDGIAKLSVKHNRASYGYSVLVNCSSDGTNLTYISTDENVITINKSINDTADFAVELVNPIITEYASGFTFKIVDSFGTALNDSPVIIKNAGYLNVTLQARKAGDCFIRCSHPDAAYDMDILVRVIEDASDTYIEPSQTLVMVSDSEYSTVTLKLANDKTDNPSPVFTWEFSEGASSFIDYTILNGNQINTGDRINIKGKRNGTVKITVSSPGAGKRDIIVLCRNLNTSASDANIYITTSQNYIRMTKGDSPTQINVTIKNLDQQFVDDIHWKITNDAEDGSDSKVIDWQTGTGSHTSSSARSVLAATASAYCIIEPLNPGTAYIDISHPKASYPTRITVVVKDTVISEPEKAYLDFKGSPLVFLKNGESTGISINFKGNGNENDINWEVTEGSVTVSGNACECAFVSPEAGSGASSSTVRVSHPSASNPLVFTIFTFDEYEQLNDFSIKNIYSCDTYKLLKTGESVYLEISTIGLDETDVIIWSVVYGAECVGLETSHDVCNVTALKNGTAVIKAECENAGEVLFTVKVLENGIIDENEPAYLSSSENVVYFDGINITRTVSVSPFNIEPYKYCDVHFELSGSDYELSCNNETAAITSLTETGYGILTVSHPLSENVLQINLQTGNRFEYKNVDAPYISASKDVLELYAGQDEVSLTAMLNHTEESDSSGVPKNFDFYAVNENDSDPVISVSYVNFSNTCYVKPLKTGTAAVRIHHQDSSFDKEVLVIVKNAPDASSSPYVTTKTNVVTIVQGDHQSVSASLVNSSAMDSSLWKWDYGQESDKRLFQIVARNGSDIMLSANTPGTGSLLVSFDNSPALRIVVVVLGSSIVQSKPYITLDKNIVTIKKGTSQQVVSQIIGGTTSASDEQYFRFNSSNSNIALVSSSNGNASIKGMNTGTALITVSNSRYSDAYLRTILVIVEDTYEDGVYISVSQNIIKLSPDDNNINLVTAKLVNGNPTDGENFIWWCDDYNLVSISSIADQCSIQATGRVGTTKVHVKHEKSSKQVDILIMVSNYDKFSFGKNSLNLKIEQLYFIPMQVPSFEDDIEINYVSSNEDICLIDGSDSVAWLCGRGYGNASLTAQIKSKEGAVLAETEMLVSVTEVEPNMPLVSLGNSIITAEAGTNQVLSAVISGENISESEKYNLKWFVENNDNHISLLDGSNSFYGPDCYVNFNYAGECVLTVVHEQTGAAAQVYIKVVDKGEIEIELSSVFESIYQDDGSITITANIINGSQEDYNNLSWSAVKVGGVNVVSVSKAKGKTCTVTPKHTGQTSVIARLPNGKTAKCIIVVMTPAQVTFDVGNIHVNPGYTEVVNYSITPENANVQWITQMASTGESFGSSSNFFSISDDPVNKQLRITGLKECNGMTAGTVTAVIMGGGASYANLPKLNVFVEYNVDVRLEECSVKNPSSSTGTTLTVVGNNCPDTVNTKKFNIVFYPPDLDIDIKVNGNYIACIPNGGKVAMHSTKADAGKKNVPEIEISDYVVTQIIDTVDNKEKSLMTVTITPHKEICETTVEVVATLPSDTSGTFSKYNYFSYWAVYDDYDIEFVNLTQVGAFTDFAKLNHNTGDSVDGLYLGDGEEAVFYMKIKNENAAGRILPLDSYSWQNKSNSKDSGYNSNGAQLKNKSRSGSDSLSKSLFGVNTGIDAYGKAPTSNMIYIYPDEVQVDNATVYHLGHLWDYYKDLPDNAGDWNKDGVLNEDIIKNIDYWLLNHEIMYNDKTLSSLGNASWSKSEEEIVDQRDLNKDYEDHVEILNFSVNGYSLMNIKNCEQIRNLPFRFTNNNIYFQECTPYIISLNNLKNNNFYFVPSDKQTVKYEAYSYWWDMFGGTERKLEHSGNITVTKPYYKYMQPIVFDTDCMLENKNVNNRSYGTLTIKYKNAADVEKIKTLNVIILKRNCQAYSKNNWQEKDSKYSVGPYSLKNNADFSFTCECTNDIRGGSGNDYKEFTFYVYPASAAVSIDISPSGNDIDNINYYSKNSFSYSPSLSKEAKNIYYVGKSLPTTTGSDGGYTTKIYRTITGNADIGGHICYDSNGYSSEKTNLDLWNKNYVETIETRNGLSFKKIVLQISRNVNYSCKWKVDGWVNIKCREYYDDSYHDYALKQEYNTSYYPNESSERSYSYDLGTVIHVQFYETRQPLTLGTVTASYNGQNITYTLMGDNKDKNFQQDFYWD